ncbi:MAG TPA: hypothetical protein VKZ89_01750 [Thermobifida alba]|nr:hypothetical protein [Thermobifida alba]
MHILFGSARIDLRAPGDEHATPPRTRGARTLPNYTGGGPYGLDVGPDTTHAEMHLATAQPTEHGSGPLVDIVCDDPDWWDQVAASAAATAQAIRELDAERGARPNP